MQTKFQTHSSNAKVLLACMFSAFLAFPSVSVAYQDFRLKNEQTNDKVVNILGNWRISAIEVDGVLVQIPEQVEGTDIQITQNQITGMVGCNRFMAPYTATKNLEQFNIQEAAATKRMCAPEAMQFENAFFRIFIGNFVVEKTLGEVSLVRDNVRIRLVRN